jgi:Flp pilus assembly protein TadD
VRIESLLSSSEKELRLPPEKRGTGASDKSLHGVITSLQRAEQLLSAGQTGRAQESFKRAAHLVGDNWSFTSELGVHVLEYARVRAQRPSEP